MKRGMKSIKPMRSTIITTRHFSSRIESKNLSKEFWLPFTNNRAFPESPKIIERAEGMYYYTHDKKKILDGTSGLWLVYNYYYINK